PAMWSALVFRFGLCLVLAPPDRGAEDVAEARTGIRRAELGHRPLFLIGLARLDRQGHTSRCLVDRGDLGIDPLAAREPVGTPFAAIGRQFRFADKAGHAVGQDDLDAALLDRRDRRSYHLAALDLVQALFERIGFKLLNAEADAFLLDIDVEHLGLNHLP